MPAQIPEKKQISTTPKVLLAFVGGVVLAAGTFWIATRPSTKAPESKAPESALLPPAPKTVDQAEVSPPEPAPATPDNPPPTVASKTKRSRTARTASDNSGQSSQSVAAPSEPPAPIAVAPAKDLPDLKPVDTSANPAPEAPPVATSQPVFRPEDQPAPATPHVVTIEAGTSLMVRLAETLSTDRNSTGDTFRGTLDSPIVLDGFIIAEKGSRVRGRIANSQKAGRVDGLSSISLTLTEINTTDGQTVKVQTSNWDKQGEKSVGSDAAKIGAGAALGAIIGAIAGGGKGAAIGAAGGGAAGTGVVLATRGKPTVLPVETTVSFRLDAPVTITEQLNH